MEGLSRAGTAGSPGRAPAGWLLAAGLGALLMYLLDPAQGRRRRSLARDRWTHWRRKSAELARTGVVDLEHRLHGMAVQARDWRRRHSAPDVVLAERVRAALGRATSHPRAIEVAVSNGQVTLGGQVIEAERPGLLAAVRVVPGVRAVHESLERHDGPGRVPALQGGVPRSGPRPEFLQRRWSAGARLLALVGGAGLAAWGLGRRDLAGWTALAAGGALAWRGAANRELAAAWSRNGAEEGLVLQKTIHIAASPDELYELWSQYDNFPRFMSLVEQVRKLDADRSHWVVRGPAGRRIEWDAVITERQPGRLLAWRSEPGAPLQHEGCVRFDADERGSAVTVRLAYQPPAGMLGQAIAALLGRDPKQALDADLMRMKSFVESGRPPHDARTPSQPTVH